MIRETGTAQFLPAEGNVGPRAPRGGDTRHGRLLRPRVEPVSTTRRPSDRRRKAPSEAPPALYRRRKKNPPPPRSKTRRTMMIRVFVFTLTLQERVRLHRPSVSKPLQGQSGRLPLRSWLSRSLATALSSASGLKGLASTSPGTSGSAKPETNRMAGERFKRARCAARAGPDSPGMRTSVTTARMTGPPARSRSMPPPHRRR